MITMTRSQWWLLAGFFLLLLPLTLFVVFSPAAEHWYAIDVLGPKLEKDFGFDAAIVDLPSGESRFQIVAVSKGSPFDQAGVQAGDLPLDVYHGYGEFYLRLQHARGGTVTLRFIRPASDSASEGGTLLTVSVKVPNPAV